MTRDRDWRPGLHREAEGLVQPEGVNAGSAASASEAAHGHLDGDVVDGGRPEAADEQASAASERDQIVDAPWGPRAPDAPSLTQSEEEQGARRA